MSNPYPYDYCTDAEEMATAEVEWQQDLLRTIGGALSFKAFFTRADDGWCGYSCLAFIIDDRPVAARLLACGIRDAIRYHLERFAEPWRRVVDDDVYNEMLHRVRMLPDESHQWWFHTELLWPFVLTLGVSVALQTERDWDVILFRHPWRPTLRHLFYIHGWHAHVIRCHATSLQPRNHYYDDWTVDMYLAFFSLK